MELINSDPVHRPLVQPPSSVLIDFINKRCGTDWSTAQCKGKCRRYSQVVKTKVISYALNTVSITKQVMKKYQLDTMVVVTTFLLFKLFICIAVNEINTIEMYLSYLFVSL